jgi:hypothetical protein
MLKRIGSTVRGEIPEAVIMCSDPLPICLAWLVGPYARVVADTDPWLAKLNIFFLSVVAAPLWSAFSTTTWLHRMLQITIFILGQQICEVLRTWAPLILQTIRDSNYPFFTIYNFFKKNKADKNFTASYYAQILFLSVTTFVMLPSSDTWHLSMLNMAWFLSKQTAE